MLGTRVPKVSLQVPGLLVAMRNQPVAVAPLGLAEPYRLVTMPEAESVDTEGGPGGVVNESTAPKPTPYELLTMAQ